MLGVYVGGYLCLCELSYWSGDGHGYLVTLSPRPDAFIVTLGDDKLVLQINGGFKGGRKWYQGVQIGMGGSTAPVSTNSDSNAPGGTSRSARSASPARSSARWG